MKSSNIFLFAIDESLPIYISHFETLNQSPMVAAASMILVTSFSIVGMSSAREMSFMNPI